MQHISSIIFNRKEGEGRCLLRGEHCDAYLRMPHKLYVYLYLAAAFFAGSAGWVEAANYPCRFDSYLSTCSIKVFGDHPVEATVIFNHCHKPMDITFILKVVENKLHWKYTYVTTNGIEIPEIQGFFPDHDVALHVQMGTTKENVNVTADFYVDNILDVRIMDDIVYIPTYEDCTNIDGGHTGRILLGVLLSLLLLSLCGAIVFHVHRLRSSKSDSCPLVDDAEVMARASTSFTLVADRDPSASPSPDEQCHPSTSDPDQTRDVPSQLRSHGGYHPISNIASNVI